MSSILMAYKYDPCRPNDAATLAKCFLRLLEGAAWAHEPHRIAFYLYDLASEFHAQQNNGNDAPHLRFIIKNDPQMTKTRLALDLLGVGVEMR